jgi:hypothetical protein
MVTFALSGPTFQNIYRKIERAFEEPQNGSSSAVEGVASFATDQTNKGSEHFLFQKRK